MKTNKYNPDTINLVIENEFDKWLGFNPFDFAHYAKQFRDNAVFTLFIPDDLNDMLEQYANNWKKVFQNWFLWNPKKYETPYIQYLDLENYGNEIFTEIFEGIKNKKSISDSYNSLYYGTHRVLNEFFTHIIPGLMNSNIFDNVNDLLNASEG